MYPDAQISSDKHRSDMACLVAGLVAPPAADDAAAAAAVVAATLDVAEVEL